jgi:hypothetical protein
LTTVNFMPTEMSKKLYFLVEYLCRSLHGTWISSHYAGQIARFACANQINH